MEAKKEKGKLNEAGMVQVGKGEREITLALQGRKNLCAHIIQFNDHVGHCGPIAWVLSPHPFQ